MITAPAKDWTLVEPLIGGLPPNCYAFLGTRAGGIAASLLTDPKGRVWECGQNLKQMLEEQGHQFSSEVSRAYLTRRTQH